MTALKLRFPTPGQAELPLEIGVHGIAARADGAGLVPAAGDDVASVRLCVDRRGVWLTVGEGVRGVHVNGRAVQRMAMLRTGDAIFVDGQELRLVSTTPAQADCTDQHGTMEITGSDLRVVLRGVGGRYHGRSFTLEQPRLVGRHADADIRIDDPGFADRHARLERAGACVRLVDLDSAEGSLVNGEPVRDALLQAGDQVVFDAQHRFVVEAPARAGRAPGMESAEPPVVDATPAPRPGRGLRLPWLLLAAVLLAMLLGALLLFGAA